MSAAPATRAAAFWLGVRVLAPLLVGVAPFGVIYGVVAVKAGIAPWAAVAMSSVLFAGAAQFLLVQLIATAAPAWLCVAAVALINLRHALYSASVAPALAALPARWKALLAYLLTDEAYAASIPHLLAQPRAPLAHWTLLGAGFALWLGWQLTTIAGVVLGSGLPDTLPLDFAISLTFIAIVVPLLRDKARVTAALAAAALAVVGAGLPYKLGVFVAALGGIAAGAWMAQRRAA